MKTATATITAAFAALLTGVSGRTHDTIKFENRITRHDLKFRPSLKKKLNNSARDSTVSKFLRLAKVFPSAGCFFHKIYQILFALQVRAKEL